MNVNLLLGIAAVGYGLYTAYVRATSPEKFGKLGAMKQRWGDRGGMIVHVIGYTVVPLIVGAVLIMSSMLGGAASSE